MECTTLLPNLKSALLGSCPDLIIKYCRCAGMARRPLTVWLVPCSNNSVPIWTALFSPVGPLPGPAWPNDSVGWHGASARVLILCFAPANHSDSVSHSFNFVFDRISSVMASADDNAAQLRADAGFLTSPSRVVSRGAFRCVPCCEGPGRLVSCDELKKLVEHVINTDGLLIPFTIQSNLAESLHGTLRVMRSQANIISIFVWISSVTISCCGRQRLTAVDGMCRLIWWWWGGCMVCCCRVRYW